MYNEDYNGKNIEHKRCMCIVQESYCGSVWSQTTYWCTVYEGQLHNICFPDPDASQHFAAAARQELV